MRKQTKKVTRFKVEDAPSVPSSCRTSSVRNFTDHVEEELQNFQQEEMKNIRQKIFLKQVIKKLQGLIALEKHSDDIVQEWQGKQESEVIKTNFRQLSLREQIIRLYPWMKIFSIIQGLNLICFIWFVSIAVVFQEKLFETNLFIVSAIQLLSLGIKVFILNYDDSFSSSNYEITIKMVLYPVIILSSSILMLIRNSFQSNALETTIQIILIVICLFVIQQIPRYFRVVKNYAEDKKLIKELRIIELFFVLLAVAHLFGLIIYSSVYLSTGGMHMSWLNSSNISLITSSWHTRYIYSVYFAITTIVTVGYGDLTPQNQAQVIVIMILQICGTSFFGYMINVIGITVDNINKKNEQYDNYQETISKLKDHYQLSEDLCLEMKMDVENKYNREHQEVSLKKNEEMDFLDYVDSTVKKNFILETNIKIIKKSIFFLTYFTVSFQNYIALKLIRVIYKKDQNIETYDPVTRQRNIIIVNHGKVNLFIEKRQLNIIKNKLVRTIQPIEGKPTLNVIGYSSLILNMDVDLFAKASQITSGYVLKMSDVLQCIEKCSIDYESFHQMRQKMLLIPMKESIEAPSLRDTNHHFAPNIFILSCKNNKRTIQKRKKADRNRKRGFLVLSKVNAQLSNEVYMVNQELEDSYDQDSEAKQKNSKNIDDFGELLSIDGDALNEDQIIASIPQSASKGDAKFLRVDQVKIFQHFMSNHNANNVASQYERACNIRSYTRRIDTNKVKKSEKRFEQPAREVSSQQKKKLGRRPSNRISKKVISIRL